MIGHSGRNSELDVVNWSDASLRLVTMDYDSVRLTIVESGGTRRVVRCDGYIGYSIRGFWDELVIDRASVLESHDSIDRAANAIANRLGPDVLPSGNEARNSAKWLALVVYFLDGSFLEIVSARITVE